MVAVTISRPINIRAPSTRQGYQLQTGFRLDPFPISTYQASEIEIEKSIFMIAGENTTVFQYDFRGASGGEEGVHDVTFEIKPLIAFRDFHSTTHENNALNSDVEVGPGQAAITPYPNLPALHFAFDTGEITIPR